MRLRLRALKGIASFVKGIAAYGKRVFFLEEQRGKLRAEALKDLAGAIKDTAEAQSTQVETLHRTVDLLKKCGVPQKRIKEIVKSKIGRALRIEQYLDNLQKYVDNGKLLDFQVKEENSRPKLSE